MAKVLIVDDAAFTRMRCNRLLTYNGYDVVEAADGNEGLQKYKEDDPDAVLLDITMPNRDGLSTLKELIIVLALLFLLFFHLLYPLFVLLNPL